MSHYDVPTAIAGLVAVAAFTLAWSVWVARDVAQARRAARRTPGTRSRVHPCHVTGCPIAGRVRVWRVAADHSIDVLHVCEGHADEGQAYGWWARERRTAA